MLEHLARLSIGYYCREMITNPKNLKDRDNQQGRLELRKVYKSINLYVNMNFKYSLIKTIISVIVGIVGGWFYWQSVFLYGGENTTTPWIISGIVITIILYVIWSLIQKK